MPFEHDGILYRSYKHPILEHIFHQKIATFDEPPDEIPFTYEDIRNAMAAIGLQRRRQASLSNFVIDLTRKRNEPEARVPPSIWEQGYDLDRMPAREVRQNYVGRFIRKELKIDPWLNWPITPFRIVSVKNSIPPEILPYLGDDEGALLSVMDYCDVLSYVLYGVPGSVLRVQHPKKWQPSEVDGLYLASYRGQSTLIPVEAKALSTGDDINLSQLQGGYNTIKSKVPEIDIMLLAIEMTQTGMRIAGFEHEDEQGNLDVERFSYVQVDVIPPISVWQ